MLVGIISAEHLRATYLRGIQLGGAWYGPAADLAMDDLLANQRALAEARMGIQFQRFRLVTDPEATLVLGLDYEVVGQRVPFVQPEADQLEYALPMAYPDVQAMDRVRIWRGGTAYDTLDLTQTSFSVSDEHLHVPLDLVTTPETVEAWALDYTIGLGQIPLEVTEWINLGVAILVLSSAGLGVDVSGGAGETSLDMDGITERIRYGQGGEQNGIYGPAIRAYRSMRDEIDLTRLRFRYSGAKFPVP